MPPIPAAQLRSLLDRYRREELHVGAVTAALVMELGAAFLAGKMSAAEFELALIAAEKLGYQRSADIGARHVSEVRSAHGAEPGPVVLAPFPLEAALVRASSTLDALARLDTPAARAQAVETHAVWADRAAKMGGRRTVERSATAAKRRWRRVPDADPCTFCATLATRGYLDDGYTSEKAALTTAMGRKYHDFCGCTATEIVDTWEPTEQEQRWIDLYEDAAGGSIEEILGYMKTHGDFNDSLSRGTPGRQ